VGAPGGFENPVRVDLTDPAAVRTYAHEAFNWNVFPQSQLRDANQIGTYTPMSIPGGRVITTGELEKAIFARRTMAPIDVLTGYHNTIPGSVSLPGAGFPLSNDPSPQILRATGGNLGRPFGRRLRPRSIVRLPRVRLVRRSGRAIQA
jgi:hypothetical protein